MGDRHRRRHSDEGHRSETAPRLRSVIRGSVVTIMPYGVFVKIPGFRKNGMVHISQLESRRVEHPNEVVSVGDEVWVKIVGMQDGGEKIEMSMKVVDQRTGKDLDPENEQVSGRSQTHGSRQDFREQGHDRHHYFGSSQDSKDAPKLYSIHKGTVASVQKYGAFIKIPGYQKNGLVHRTQISRAKVEHPEEVLDFGEEVWVKVITSEEDGGKIGLSMKTVNQSNGEDLDPNHVQASLDEQRRKTGFKKEIPRIELGAVYDTTCKKCGGKGHFAQDCYQTPSTTTGYDLLPDVDYLIERAKNATDSTGPGPSSKKKKKEKKHKKKKRKHRKSKEESDSDDEPKAKKRKKSKHKRHEPNSSSSSESSSDSDTDSSTDRHSRKRKKAKKRK